MLEAGAPPRAMVRTIDEYLDEVSGISHLRDEFGAISLTKAFSANERSERIMFEADRRIFLQSFAIGAGVLASSQAFGAAPDGHAAGYDVSPASDYLKTIPRKSGDPVVFTASLDKGPIKATSGGWAREITTRGLPIATHIAGAHLFLNAGGAREMHWHDSAEWAYIVEGHSGGGGRRRGPGRSRQSRPRRSLVFPERPWPLDSDPRCGAVSRHSRV